MKTNTIDLYKNHICASKIYIEKFQLTSSRNRINIYHF